MLYSAAFDVSKISGLGTLTVSTAGKPDIAVTLAQIVGSKYPSGTSSKFYHWVLNFVGGPLLVAEDTSGEVRRTDIALQAWESALTTTLQTLATGQGWGSVSTLQITMSLTTGLVTASYASTFALTWSTALGRKLCGFSGNQSGAASYVGTVVPLYVVVPTLRKVSRPTPNTLERATSSHVRADGGGGFGIKRYATPLRRKWVQQFTERARCERLYAVSTHPWTFEDLIEQCKGGYPFLVHDGGFGYSGDEGFSLSTEGGSASPQGSGPDRMNFTTMHVEFDCYVEGYLS